MSWLKMILVGVLSAFGVQVFDTAINPPKRFASIDVVLVVQEQINAMAESSVKENTLHSSPTEVSQQMKQIIEEMAAEYDVTILVSQAILSNDVPELTQELRKRVRQQWQIQ